MRHKEIHILFLLLLFSCNSSKLEEDKSKKEIEYNKAGKHNIEEWDKHQFFDDLEWTSLDSLSKVIQYSDSIIAYNWNDKDGNSANVQHHIVDAYGKFDKRVGKNILLNASQKTDLKVLLSDSTNYEGSNTTCFIPHIAFVYYKKNQIIGQSNLCFLCSGVKSVPKSTTALNEKGNKKLKNFCREIGLEIIDDYSQLTH